MSELEKMVERLINFGYIKSKQVKQAFLKIDRKLFVPKELEEYAYADQPLPIPGNATISAPHMHAIMLEELELKKGMKVLEIGFGSGILLAYIAEIIGKRGKVYGIEINKNTFEFGKNNIQKTPYKNIFLFLGDGKKGLAKHAPFDRIVCSAGTQRIPNAWFEQLKVGGILIAPVGHFGYQSLYKFVKSKQKIERRFICEVAFLQLK